MPRVITFSRIFPSYHPRKREETFFVEKIWKGLFEERDDALYSHEVAGIWSAYCEMKDGLIPKHHTIRVGNRWKAGDLFSPRVWSGKPYNSKQIIIAPDIQIKKVWDLEITTKGEINISGKKSPFAICTSSGTLGLWNLSELAKNDGLSVEDLCNWFQMSKHKAFSGQIICWDENIEY